MFSSTRLSAEGTLPGLRGAAVVLRLLTGVLALGVCCGSPRPLGKYLKKHGGFKVSVIPDALEARELLDLPEAVHQLAVLAGAVVRQDLD